MGMIKVLFEGIVGIPVGRENLLAVHRAPKMNYQPTASPMKQRSP